MTDASGQPLIFISYSHKDREWLEYVRSFLAPAMKHDVLTVWEDNKLVLGTDWHGDINAALDACNIFILLVSRYSLASDFILNTEVPRILERLRRGEKVAFCPIVVTPPPLHGVDWLNEFNRLPKDGRALSEFPEPERDRVMTAIVADIAKIIGDAESGELTKPATAKSSKGYASSVIDISRLPETPYKNLVGRDDQLKLLDEAWADDKTNIVSLVAWGGAGKTAIVSEWLKRMRDKDYVDAAAVLGWSFYSQGTKERATSADDFLDWALDKLGVKVAAVNATIKGEKLAEALGRGRVLLLLDGVEPLQHGPSAQEGQLKDRGLRSLLRRFAAMPPAIAHGLIVITSRLAVRDIENWNRNSSKSGSTVVIDLAHLADEAGAALLTDNGVKGSDKELREAVRDFEGHALTLSLLASFLARRNEGDVRRRDRIGPLLQETDSRGHDHARRVMKAYEAEWLKDEPVLIAVLHLVGLFDRPASANCLAALRHKPPIEGLTDSLVNLRSDSWADAVAALREVRLLDPDDPTMPGALDAHPLVREWFGERLRSTNEAAWRAAHGRLFDHLRRTTKECDQPTLESLAPLYQAIAHGCRAGRYREALEKVYLDRMCRWRGDGVPEFYTFKKLGAVGSDLAAIYWFFERPYEVTVPALASEHSWLLGQTAFALRALGRFAEALVVDRAALGAHEADKDWENAAIGASNISETELQMGNVNAAKAVAAISIAHADRSASEFQMLYNRTTYADAVHAMALYSEADRFFADAELRQRKWEPNTPRLYSVQGYRYCDLLLDRCDWSEAKARGLKAIEIGRRNKWLLDVALGNLVINRAHLGLALEGINKNIQSNICDISIEGIRSDEVIDDLYAAGIIDHVPSGFLVRTVLRRSIGDWPGATRDLDEVEEIAEPGPMRLFLCDMALERARLAFAQIEAFAPLNGMLEKDNPPKPKVPSVEEKATLKAEAEKQIKIADDYIRTCGYHRRDEELAELQAVLRGEKKFAELPPRV